VSLDDPDTRWLIDRVSIGPLMPPCGELGLICEYIPRMLRVLYSSGMIRSQRALTFVAARHVPSDELYILVGGPDGPFLDAWRIHARHSSPRTAARWADRQAWRIQSHIRLELAIETHKLHEWKAVAPHKRLMHPAAQDVPFA
jgi:hypothetical protein